MKLGSTHNHSTGSDGKLSPEKLIKKAIELKWGHVYFTDHYHIPRKIPVKCYNGYFSESYIENIKRLREKYKDRIEVCFGVELDWFENYADWLRNEAGKESYDYVIGGIHYLKDKNREYRSMESGKEYWIETAKRFGSTQNYVEEYYKQLRKLASSGVYDSVAHFDYIKVYNEKQDLFLEEAEWYKKEVVEALDLIKRNKLAIEINGGGLRKCGEQFPSLWILKEAKKRNIPVTIGLDSHWEEHFDNRVMEKMIKIAGEAGYKSVVRFKNRKMIEMRI